MMMMMMMMMIPPLTYNDRHGTLTA